MKKTLDILKSTIAVIALLTMTALLPSCSSEEIDFGSKDDGDSVDSHKFGFTLTVSRPASDISRAQGFVGPGYDTGEGYELYIDIPNGDFKFLFFDKNNLFLAEYEVLTIIPTSMTRTSKTYYINGLISKDIKDTPLKVVALANWKSYDFELKPNETTIEDLCGQIYDFSAESMLLSEVHTIPLYGVSKLETLEFDELNYAKLKSTIHLLRAFAKIEVLLNDDSQEWEMEYARLTRHNTKGYCAPADIFNQDDYVHGNYDEDYVAEPNIPENVETADHLDFIKIERNHYVAYVPEYKNIDRPEAERAQIEVKFTDSRKDKDFIDFKYYDKIYKPPFDILRNNWYRFIVNKHPEKDEVIVQVVPYFDIDLYPEFGLLIGKDLIPVYDDNGNIFCYYDRETGKYYDKNNRGKEIPNPYLGKDPNTGYTIIRDDDGEIIYYYDESTGQYYDPKLNPIENPYT